MVPHKKKLETPFLAPWRLLLRNMYGYDPNLYSVPNIIVKKIVLVN